MNRVVYCTEYECWRILTEESYLKAEFSRLYGGEITYLDNEDDLCCCYCIENWGYQCHAPANDWKELLSWDKKEPLIKNMIREVRAQLFL